MTTIVMGRDRQCQSQYQVALCRSHGCSLSAVGGLSGPYAGSINPLTSAREHIHPFSTQTHADPCASRRPTPNPGIELREGHRHPMYQCHNGVRFAPPNRADCAGPYHLWVKGRATHCLSGRVSAGERPPAGPNHREMSAVLMPNRTTPLTASSAFIIPTGMATLITVGRAWSWWQGNRPTRP